MTLELSDTALLVDALKPPPAMELAVAVGTTFTLDLASLLAIPVAASFAAAEQDEEDPANLLETIRRYSDATVLFCQAGAIAVPPRYRAALTFVEQSVIEVKKPKGGIFHPKLWAVRYEGGGRAIHRVLVMSRNLTFDRALDVIVRLDEDPKAEERVDISQLVQLLRDLPRSDYAARPVDSRQTELVLDLAASLKSARLTLPPPFESGRLVVGRPGRRRTPFHKECDHALGVSPFLTPSAVSAFVDTAASWAGIVSRREALESVARSLADVHEVLRVKDLVLNAQESADVILDDSDDGAQPDKSDPPESTMRGLHAKLYVQDLGSRSTVWLGSANLTSGGFGGNYEILVELEGPKGRVGVDALLDPARKRRDLSMLVEPHLLPEAPEDVPDVEEEATEAEALAFDIASCQVELTVSPDGERWRAELLIEPFPHVGEVTVSARPLSLKESDFVSVTDGTAEWQGMDLTAVTPFVVLRLHGPRAQRTVLVRADLIGDPEHRRGAVLARAIRSPEDFLRYLSAMLGFHGGIEFPIGGTGLGAGERGMWLRGIRADRILEDLMTTVARAPKRLDSLHETLRELDGHPETREYVPDDFRQLWEAVRRVQKRRAT